MSRVDRIDQFQQRHPVLGFPLAVIYKFFDDQGNLLAALMTYYAFLSFFPLLLLLTTILGFVLEGNPDLQATIIDSLLGQLPIIGDQLDPGRGLKGSVAGLIVGVLVSLYGALGVSQAAQNTFNRCWGIPRNERPNPFTARLRSLIFLVVIGLGVIGTTAASGLTAFAGDFGLGPWSSALITLGTVVGNALLFLVTYRVLTARVIAIKWLWPGALVVAIGWQGLQVGGAVYVDRVLRGSLGSYGTFSLILGLLAWMYLAAIFVVLSAEINAVRAHRMWPRSLLAPFSDNIPLTEGDRRAYASYVKAERHKSWEHVVVEFDRDEAPAARAAEPSAVDAKKAES